MPLESAGGHTGFMSTDIEIASRAELKPIAEIAASIGLAYDDIVPHGHHAAKVPLLSLIHISSPRDRG